MAGGKEAELLEVGFFDPDHAPRCLSAGEVGYLATGLKVVRRSGWGHGHPGRRSSHRSSARLPAGAADGLRRLYPVDSEDYPELREALERLR